MTSYVYDDTAGSGGRLVEKRFFANLTAYNNGQGTPSERVVYSYDAFGRQIETLQDGDGDLQTTGDQREVANTYNDLGQLVMVASPEGVLHYEYDAVSGQHTRTWTGTTEETSTTDTHYAYDNLGRLDSVTQDRRNGADIDADPNTAGNQPEVTDYVYDLLGNLDQVRLPNGVVSDYDYDNLNRLVSLKEFNDTDLDGVLDQGENLLAQFDYELLADGKRSGVTETDDADQTTSIDWFYDNLGRLTREVYDSYDNDLDFTADYTYDLAGNRLTKKTDSDPTVQQLADYRSGQPMLSGNVDEEITYGYDANDRLLTEAKDDRTVANQDTYTTYGYGTGNAATQQTRKTVHLGDDASDPVIEDDTYTYNLQGRMASAEVEKFDSTGQTLTEHTKSEYKYGDDGIRVEQKVSTDVNLDGDFTDAGDTVETTKYLNDANNPTGYSQVLEEKDGTGAVKTSYTLGLDIIAQADAAGTNYFLLKDGHGSTVALVNVLGQIVVGQVYRYDAFGNALGFTLAAAYTSHLYCGEHTDPTGKVYLRRREYDPETGTFTTLDSFAGNLEDPQSLHKYLFCVNDTINRIDPSGCESLVGMLCATTIGAIVDNMDRVMAYTAKQYVWACIETGMEVIIGKMISCVTHYPFDIDDDKIGRSIMTNFASNMTTSWLGGDKWNRLRQMLDFSIRTASDVWLGGETLLWSAGVNLASLGFSELLAHYGKKILGECIAKYGGCFVAGTPVVVGAEQELVQGDCHPGGQAGVVAERKTVTRSIETIGLGSRVITEAPDSLPHDDELGEPNQATWQHVRLLQHRSDGTEIEMELLRPCWWIEVLGLEAGRVIDLDFPELQTRGTARVLGISACPPIDIGEGRVVIGRFATRAASNLLRVTLEDGSHFTGTTNHRVWSIDGNDWKRLEDFLPGERLLVLDGETTISTISPVPRPADVFNIEVDSEHVYRIMRAGVLVHNADYIPDEAITKSLAGLADIPWFKKLPSGCQDVADRIISVVGGVKYKIEPKFTPRLGKRAGIETGWANHWVVVLNGRVYDALTGPEGLPVEVFKKIWEASNEIHFGF